MISRMGNNNEKEKEGVFDVLEETDVFENEEFEEGSGENEVDWPNMDDITDEEFFKLEVVPIHKTNTSRVARDSNSNSDRSNSSTSGVLASNSEVKTIKGDITKGIVTTYTEAEILWDSEKLRRRREQRLVVLNLFTTYLGSVPTVFDAGSIFHTERERSEVIYEMSMRFFISSSETISFFLEVFYEHLASLGVEPSNALFEEVLGWLGWIDSSDSSFALFIPCSFRVSALQLCDRDLLLCEKAISWCRVNNKPILADEFKGFLMRNLSQQKILASAGVALTNPDSSLQNNNASRISGILSATLLTSSCGESSESVGSTSTTQLALIRAFVEKFCILEEDFHKRLNVLSELTKTSGEFVAISEIQSHSKGSILPQSFFRVNCALFYKLFTKWCLSIGFMNVPAKKIVAAYLASLGRTRKMGYAHGVSGRSVYHGVYCSGGNGNDLEFEEALVKGRFVFSIEGTMFILD